MEGEVVVVFKQGESGSEKFKFKKGQSGNPLGKPKGARSFRSIIRELSDKKIDVKDLSGERLNIPAGKAVVIGLFHRAIFNRDVTAAKTIIEHMDGKKMELSGDEDAPIVTKIIREIVDPNERVED